MPLCVLCLVFILDGLLFFCCQVIFKNLGENIMFVISQIDVTKVGLSSAFFVIFIKRFDNLSRVPAFSF